MISCASSYYRPNTEACIYIHNDKQFRCKRAGEKTKYVEPVDLDGGMCFAPEEWARFEAYLEILEGMVQGADN